MLLYNNSHLFVLQHFVRILDLNTGRFSPNVMMMAEAIALNGNTLYTYEGDSIRMYSINESTFVVEGTKAI